MDIMVSFNAKACVMFGQKFFQASGLFAAFLDVAVHPIPHSG